jgi:uncharacterized LabA/DUF88 family protein
MSDNQVALFIDFENVRYSMLNTFHCEPRASDLVEKTRAHGHMTVARAYADSSEHPENLLRDLQICGVSNINISAHQIAEKKKSGSDMEMLMDIVETLLDRPAISTYVLMTGDRDFIRAVTMARNRFGKKVIISGVPGTVSTDLIKSAGGNFDPIIVEPLSEKEKMQNLIEAIDGLEKNRPFLAFKYLVDVVISSCDLPPANAEDAKALVSRAYELGYIKRYQRDNGHWAYKLDRKNGVVASVIGARVSSP